MEWSEQLEFCFPEGLGRIQEVLETQIAVNWDQSGQTLRGLYVIKAKVRFDLQPTTASKGILIEHVDLDDDVVYFEYGVPFERIAADSTVQQLKIQDIQVKAADSLQLGWQVNVQEVKVAQEVAQEVVQEVIQEVVQTAAQKVVQDGADDTSLVKLFDLKEHFITEQIVLNKIRI